MGKKKMTGKVLRRMCALAAALAAAGVSTLSVGVYADNKDYDKEIAALEEKAERIKKENEAREVQIGDISGDVSENEAQMDLLKQQLEGINDEVATYGMLITTQQTKIADMENEIYAVEKGIESKQTEIEHKRTEISELEAQNKENLKKYASLIRALYMNNTSDTLPILEGSDDWYNFFTYVDVVQNISSQNLEFMNRLLDDIHYQENLIEGLQDDIAKLNADKAELLDKKDSLETELSELESKKTEVQNIANERDSDLQSLSRYNDSLLGEIRQIRSEISASNDEVEEINQAIKELIRSKQSANGDAPVYSSDGFRWPLDSCYTYLTTHFGYDAWRGGNHYGIDVSGGGIGGKNIYAAQGGTVITAFNDSGWHGGYGNYVIIDHGGGISTVYAHCSATTVDVGQVVSKGDVIGYVGTTGWSTGNHLHFETRVNGTAVDPFTYGYEYV